MHPSLSLSPLFFVPAHIAALCFTFPLFPEPLPHFPLLYFHGSLQAALSLALVHTVPPPLYFSPAFSVALSFILFLSHHIHALSPADIKLGAVIHCSFSPRFSCICWQKCSVIRTCALHARGGHIGARPNADGQNKQQQATDTVSDSVQGSTGITGQKQLSTERRRARW